MRLARTSSSQLRLCAGDETESSPEALRIRLRVPWRASCHCDGNVLWRLFDSTGAANGRRNQHLDAVLGPRARFDPLGHLEHLCMTYLRRSNYFMPQIAPLITIGRHHLLQSRRAALALAQVPKRNAEIVLGCASFVIRRSQDHGV
jgi:hypothetical protein